MAAKNERTGATMLQTIPMLTQSQKGLFSLARLQGHAFKSAMRYQIEALSSEGRGRWFESNRVRHFRTKLGTEDAPA